MHKQTFHYWNRLKTYEVIVGSILNAPINLTHKFLLNIHSFVNFKQFRNTDEFLTNSLTLLTNHDALREMDIESWHVNNHKLKAKILVCNIKVQ